MSKFASQLHALLSDEILPGCNRVESIIDAAIEEHQLGSLAKNSHFPDEIMERPRECAREIARLLFERPKPGLDEVAEIILEFYPP
jgi:hypothetical protein